MSRILSSRIFFVTIQACFMLPAYLPLLDSLFVRWCMIKSLLKCCLNWFEMLFEFYEKGWNDLQKFSKQLDLCGVAFFLNFLQIFSLLSVRSTLRTWPTHPRILSSKSVVQWKLIKYCFLLTIMCSVVQCCLIYSNITLPSKIVYYLSRFNQALKLMSL